MRLLKAAAASAVAALLGAGLLSTASAGAGTGWTIQRMPKPGFGMSLPSVSCVTGGTCVAVGSYGTKSGREVEGVPFAARQVSGGAWTEQTVPEPAGSVTGGLGAVSCPTASFCMALGGVDGRSLSWTWDGTKWSFVSVPAPRNPAQLSWVSCWSATACMAVGGYPTRSRPSADLVEKWDGTRWAIQSAGTGAVGDLSEVSCTAASFCMAIGAGTPRLPWVTRSWNGSIWTVHALPKPAGTTGAVPLGVSCASATACTTVGYAVTQSSDVSRVVAERWNGTAWQIQSIPAPSGNSLLSGVSCATATSCTAVGDNDAPAPVAESWNSTTGWTLQASATPSRAMYSELSDVSCLPAACTATGHYNIVSPSTAGIPLAEHR